MTFNIRLDGEEIDPNNHFTQRIARLNHTIATFKPAVIGLQEPFAGQLLHLLSVLPREYRPIGYRDDDLVHDLGHPLRHNDMQVAMLYDTTVLQLMEQDYIWLSKTPRIPNSKDWNSLGIRTLNIARFRRIVDGTSDDTTDIIMFNTHLDVASEHARREQAIIVDRTITEWRIRFPYAMILLTGDFNSCPGQMAHTILTKHMHDAFDKCSTASSSCIFNPISCTFHGWLGSSMNSYLLRALHYIIFTVHGMGFRLPHHIPRTARDVARILINPATYQYQFSMMEAIPATWTRFHVDWILYADSYKGQDGQTTLEGTANTGLVNGAHVRVSPVLVWVADVRRSNFSSDHFPVMAVFHVTRQT